VLSAKGDPWRKDLPAVRNPGVLCILGISVADLTDSMPAQGPAALEGDLILLSVRGGASSRERF